MDLDDLDHSDMCGIWQDGGSCGCGLSEFKVRYRLLVGLARAVVRDEVHLIDKAIAALPEGILDG